MNYKKTLLLKITENINRYSSHRQFFFFSEGTKENEMKGLMSIASISGQEKNLKLSMSWELLPFIGSVSLSLFVMYQESKI